MTAWLALALLACTGDDPDPTPDPGPLEAGMARLRVPAPVGIGTAGYGPLDAEPSDSPFAEIYPATKHLHGHPEIKVVALSRGEAYELIFVRLDSVGTFQQLRQAVVIELEARLGRTLDHSLVIGATHTHSGPGRVIDGGGVFDLIADRFFPEFYDRLVDAIADGVEAALDDLAPARVGHVMSRCDEAHGDRRCEDGLEYQNGTIPVLAVEREDEIQAVVMAYAVHGTVLDIDDLNLSQDVSGAIEEAVEDTFDHPVEALMFNAWGADMSPQDPGDARREGATVPGGYDKMDAAGVAVADSVHRSLGDLVWDEDPTVAGHTSRIHIDRDFIGYESDEFPYDYGGVYCAGEEDCDPATTVEELDQHCIPFSADYPAPNQTLVTAGQVGGLYFVTWPGEAGTLLAEALLDDIRTFHTEVEDVAFFGYTQDYTGYSILEDDWWQGGYEASGALWGPKQGEHLRFWSKLAFGTYMKTHVMGIEPDPVEPFAAAVYDPYMPEDPVAPGTVLSEVASEVGPTDVVLFAVAGREAWLGTPVATLETADGEPVLRPGGAPLDSDGYAFWWDHTVDPTYEDVEEASERTFTWTLSLPVQKTVVGTPTLEPGDYRLRVALPTDSGGAEEVTSAVFTVTGG